MVWVARFFALQLGFVHPCPSVVRAANAVLEEPEEVDGLLELSHPNIILWACRVDTMSADVLIEYREGITGSHC